MGMQEPPDREDSAWLQDSLGRRQQRSIDQLELCRSGDYGTLAT
jgi:hypothetical protein